MEKTYTPKVFISYAREDGKHAELIYKRLLHEGFKPWIDRIDLLPGEPWGPVIQREIKEADFFLVLLSNNSNVLLSNNSNQKESYFSKEFRWGLDVQKQKRQRSIYLIPVKLEECEIPSELGEMHWFELKGDNGFDPLMKALKSKLPKKSFPGIHNQPTEEVFTNAQEICASGITLFNTIAKFHDPIVDCVVNGTDIKIILASTSDQVLEQIKLRSWAKTTPDFYRNRIDSTISRLKVIGDEILSKGQNTGSLKIGLLPFVPSFGLFISFSRKNKGLAYVEMYHHLIAAPPRRFLYRNIQDEIDYQFYNEQFKAMWDKCLKIDQVIPIIDY